MKKSSCLKPQDLSHGIWYEASPSEPLPSLFKLYPWGQKRPHPRGHMFYIGLYREKHEKKFLSETIRLRALIFSMKHHLVDFYQVCSNNALWGQKWPNC